ncbi:MAG TPA: TerB family tellurite resistance protein [Candidatus Caenarcaniphilales bacterium]|nr:TerB family tellurite resistance protein [Candidatus Caenarcaniphilales bacterium]
MVLRRFLGLGAEATPASDPQDASETATIRRIVAELQALEPAQRRHLAGFAYILSRAAHADLQIAADETQLMEQIVREIGGVPAAQALLVVEIAKHQTELYGATEDYLVTREWARQASEEQRIGLVEACFAVVAADHTITAEEYAELTQIADELDLSRSQLNTVRREYADHLAAIQRMRRPEAAGGR